MSDPAFRALLYGVENGELQCFSPQASVLFLRAPIKPLIEPLSKTVREIDDYHYFKRINDNNNTAPSIDKHYDIAIIHAPKQMVETRYWTAMALKVLKIGGTLIIAAENNAGGNRLSKLLEEAGLDVMDYSKHKCRVCHTLRSSPLDEGLLDQWIAGGSMQKSPETGFWTVPGIFGWDKIDRGSEHLTEIIPPTLKGTGADFGTGYGYLSHHTLNHAPKIQRLYCIDHDFRAIEAAQKNLSAYKDRCDYLWADIPAEAANIPRNLDFIIMNPPFHQEKNTKTDIGHGFILRAAHSLKKGGTLFMVANAHLPYEAILNKNYYRVEAFPQKDGFKTFKAVR